MLHLRLTKVPIFELLIDFKISVTNHDIIIKQVLSFRLVVCGGLGDKYFVTVLTVEPTAVLKAVMEDRTI